jgi:hypothetical protein
VQKIREKEKKISDIIRAKNAEKDQEKLQPLLADLQKEYKELEKLYKDLDDEKRHIRFEHPDKGVEVERKYRAYKIRSIEDMENELGTDGKLSRLKQKVFLKYGPAESAPLDGEKKQKSPPPPQGVPPGPERPKLSY